MKRYRHPEAPEAPHTPRHGPTAETRRDRATPGGALRVSRRLAGAVLLEHAGAELEPAAFRAMPMPGRGEAQQPWARRAANHDAGQPARPAGSERPLEQEAALDLAAPRHALPRPAPPALLAPLAPCSHGHRYRRAPDGGTRRHKGPCSAAPPHGLVAVRAATQAEPPVHEQCDPPMPAAARTAPPAVQRPRCIAPPGPAPAAGTRLALA